MDNKSESSASSNNNGTSKGRNNIKQLQSQLDEKEELLKDAKALILYYQGKLDILVLSILQRLLFR